MPLRDCTQRKELEGWAILKRREMVLAFRYWVRALIAAKFGDRDFQNLVLDELISQHESKTR
jgi:hypothetical protein